MPVSVIFRTTIGLPFILLILVGSVASALATDQRRPNVLFIVIDDLKPLLACYGDEFAVTPHIDRLAAGGMVFENAYCQQAVCGPSRANLLTGLRPDRTQVWDLATKMRDINPDLITLPQYFRINGYETAGIGKIFDNRCVDRDLDKPSWSLPYFKEADDYYSEQTAKKRSQWQDPETVRRMEIARKEAKAKGLSRAEAGRYERRNAGPSTECLDVPDNTYRDGAHVLRALDILTDLSKGDKPFFFAVGIDKPHLPFTAPKKYWELYQREKLPLAKFRGNAEGTPLIAFQNGGELRNYSDIPALASYSEDFGGLKLPEAKQKELIHGYYAACSYADALVGQLLGKLDALGLSENTIIVLIGDHGWHLGDNNLWCKHSNFEQAVRAPLIISAPGVDASKTNSPAEFVDVFPTLADLANLQAPKQIDGSSLLPILKNPKARVKEFTISQYPRGSQSGRVMGYSIRTDHHRYTVWMEQNWVSTQPYEQKFQVANELYDYQTSSPEIRNLVNDPKYAVVLKDMQTQLLSFFKSQVRAQETSPK